MEHSIIPDPFGPLEAQRAALLDAALAHAAFDGWNRDTLLRAARTIDMGEGDVENAFPKGPVDAIDYWAERCDRQMQADLAETDLDAMKIRQRVATGVRSRVEAIGFQHREAARRAAARLLLPDAGGRSVTILWRASDRIWRAIGDTSTDGNFYSKRTILSGVLASTLNAWLQADEEAEAWAVLDARIANVMEFEKVKARWREVRGTLPDPMKLLARLRYPR